MKHQSLKTANAEWHGCYDDSWKGYIVDDAFAHPAKFSRGLIERIYKHMLAEGMIRRWQTVVDPFGGIGTGGIIAASNGLRWVGVELEEKFVDLATHNFSLHLMTWAQFSDPIPRMVKGDSRKLRECLRGVLADAVCCSPPYSEAIPTRSGPSGLKCNRANGEPLGIGKAERQMNAEGYGATPGQLGSMPTGSVDSIVSSPPYANHIGNENGIDYAKAVDPTTSRTGSAARDSLGGPYSEAPGNLGNLPAGIVDSVVSSPPYEGIRQDGGRIAQEGVGGFGSYTDEPAVYWHTQRDQNNIGNLKTGETFWTAAAEIVRECAAILKPGGWSAWVVKDFVRDKQRVPFCDDWRKLLEACGFTVRQRVHAMLVKESRNPDLFGGESVKRTERKSFFRRLAEKKGSPRIDFEEVIFAQREPSR